MEKICKKCLISKPFDCFYKAKLGKLGFAARCKKCIDHASRNRYDTSIVSIKSKQCTKCKELRPQEDFHNDRRRKDGKFPQCKFCKNDNYDLAKAKQIEDSFHTNEKQCTKCNEWLSFDNFSKAKNGKFGLNSVCRKCKSSTVRADKVTLELQTDKRQCNTCKEIKQLSTEFHFTTHRKIYRRKCKVCVNKRQKIYVANNRNMYRTSSVKWQKSNVEKVRHMARLRKSRKKSAIGFYTINEWAILKIKYNYTCLMCKQSEPNIKLTIDHIVPLSKGGSNYIENIQPLCASCNAKKHTQTIDLRT